ncbi:MAG: hypothetical protein GXO60_03780 [Epsilonproteobacteria bacterium]|nr:hypothetical protein [Campylobacterota bacterium]
MDKSFIMFVAVGIGFFYLITDFVGNIERDDGYPTDTEYRQEHQYDKYTRVDSVGRAILDVEGLPLQRQLEAWHRSSLKGEALSLFPDFDEIKRLVKDRVITPDFREVLLEKIGNVEKTYLRGEITSDQARKKLESL